VTTPGHGRTDLLGRRIPLIQAEIESHIGMKGIEGLSNVLLMIDLAFRPWADEKANMPFQILGRGIGRAELGRNGGDGGRRKPQLKEPHDKGAARQPSRLVSIGKRADLPVNSLIHDAVSTPLCCLQMTNGVSKRLMYRP